MNAAFAQILIFADIGDWFKLIVPAVFVIFWVISQISGSKEQVRKPAKKRRGPQPLAPNDGNVRGEIDDFLRRVKEQAGIPNEELDEEDWDEEPELTRPQREPVQEAQVLEAEVIEPPISARLLSNIDASDVTYAGDHFARQTGALGARVGSADENMEMHTHEVFDHEVGGLSKSSGDAEQPDASDRPVTVPATAEEIRQMLSGPEGVRKAIIMSEILNRPADRW